MTKPNLFSIIESPLHPKWTEIYNNKSINEIQFNSMRKALVALKDIAPDFIVAEFFYGYGNNYAGINISNLDVLLYSLQKYASAAKVIVLVDKKERKYVDKLNEILPLYAILSFPVNTHDINTLL